MSRAKSSSPSGISTQSIVWAAIGWAAIALMFYLFLSAPTDGPHIVKPEECDKVVKEFIVRPNWYRYGTYIFQTVAIACSGILCLRNWRSPKIISGRNVWLGLGLGILSWGIGNLIFGYLDFQYQSGLIAGGAKGAKDLVKTFPSIADIFFTATYVFLSWGMAMSVIGRRLNLYPKQWAIVGAVGFVGVGLAAYVTFAVGGGFTLDTGKILNIVYALGDIWLLVVATILLLAFWGGKAAQSWRLLGSAGISMFLSDLLFNYSINVADICKAKPYQSGEPAEFFWILAFILWGMAAALEFDLSSRPTTRSRRG
ncbi:MAG: hypothetical protein DCF19_10360 [Pseudanabaena frigida]|uniref:Uncharacterized protein n=1 Tax=Pseudanabaena frigida TaxID=945775 RepID=A0A2W4W7J1_9CYAN|nr:MAG: hypothetical protein DCF19_10360 [Pseudanabaena frigida]